MYLTHQIFNLTDMSLCKYSFPHHSRVTDPCKTVREGKGKWKGEMEMEKEKEKGKSRF